MASQPDMHITDEQIGTLFAELLKIIATRIQPGHVRFEIVLQHLKSLTDEEALEHDRIF